MLALVGGSLTAAELARNFINTRGSIQAFVETTPAPWIARQYRPSPVEGVALGKPGSIKLIVSLDERHRRDG